MTVNTFPVDDSTLLALEHALDATIEVDEAGEHRLVGSEYSLQQLLEFYSGYDESNLMLIDDRDNEILTYEYTDGFIYSEQDVIHALIDEVRRLRLEVGE